MIKIYHDTTIEDVTNIATRIESLALKCSPLIQALMKSLTDSLKKSDLKTALKLVKLIKEGGRKGGLKEIQSVKTLTTGLIPRLKKYAETYKAHKLHNPIEFENRTITAKELEEGADKLQTYYTTIKGIYAKGLKDVKAAQTINEVNKIENDVLQKTQNLSTGVKGDVLVEIYKLTQMSQSELENYAKKINLRLKESSAWDQYGYYNYNTRKFMPDKYKIIQQMKDDPIADRFYNAVSNRKKELGEKAPKTKSLFEYAAKAERIPQSILDKAENYANDVFDKVLKRIEIILQERSDSYNNKPSKLSNRKYQIWIEMWIKENGSVKELRKTIIDRIEEHARNMKNPVFIDFIGNKNIDENTRSKWQTSINNKIASIASEFKKKVEALFNKYSDIP